MRLQKRALLSPSRGTFPSPQEAFSSSEATAVKASGRGNQPNEEDTFVSFSFFIVLMALPVVSVLFMCLRYMCERQSSRRERRERREREARAALRTHFVLASSSLPETSAANGDRRREEGAGGSDAWSRSSLRMILVIITLAVRRRRRVDDRSISGRGHRRRQSRVQKKTLFATSTTNRGKFDRIVSHGSGEKRFEESV